MAIEKERERSNITVDEVWKQVGRLKIGKASGRDGLVNEVWLFGKDGLIERWCKIMKGFLGEWREGQIYPILKKDIKEKVENYQGITLLTTAYELYAMVQLGMC